MTGTYPGHFFSIIDIVNLVSPYLDMMSIKKIPFLLYVPIWVFFLLIQQDAAAQCPDNIGFETGYFAPWECYAGNITSSGQINVLLTGPQPNRHVMIKNYGVNTMDFYGQFPVNCPNGSGYSIRLGNEEKGAQAERVSYTFTIPSNVDNYSIIYNYAVVFQNPNHSAYQQPRFTAKVFDVDNQIYIDCASFDYAASSSLPGFKVSATQSDVYYKPWSPVTIKLAGFAGRTLRLEFTTNDCTLGGHFGYAYIDVNENCSSPVGGNVYCIGASSVTLTAPYGYQSYSWSPPDFSQVLGTARTLTIKPPPVPNTVFALIITPFPGSGCLDTLYATMKFLPDNFNLNVLSPIEVCTPNIVDLTSSIVTAGSTPGMVFTYFLDSTLDNYVPAPKFIAGDGLFYINASNSDGCSETKPVIVTIADPPDLHIIDPPIAYYPNKVNLTDTSIVKGNIPGFTLSYWKDSLATISLPNPTAVDTAGIYYIKSANLIGCKAIDPVKVVIDIARPPNAFSPNGDGINDLWMIPGIQLYQQCRVDIYNRYGQLVFHSIGYTKPWDGTFNNQPLPIATYYYVIKLDNAHAPIGGSITIFK